ncbi:neurofibromin 1, partial [Clonorchis sinensis]
LSPSMRSYPISEQTEHAFASKDLPYVLHSRFPVIETVAAGTNVPMVLSIIDKLITLTIDEEQMYPSIQTKIWGNLGQVPQLVGLVLDSFIQRSVSCGLGSLQAEIMADTSVALAAANVQLVSKKVLSKLCRFIEKTCSAPTTLLEHHPLWPEIAPMLRYLLMLSFNNCIDIRSHLPRLFHIATLLVCTGPLSLRASMHGFVINVIHSLCTSALAKQLSDKTVQQLRQLLAEFTLPKFYEVFGIQHCKCAPISAFPHFRPGERSGLVVGGSQLAASAEGLDRPERLTLSSLEFLTDTLLEVMSLVIKEVPEFTHWLEQWTNLARKFAFQNNPALQPRAIIVLGCICKGFTDTDIKQLLRIMSRALESYANELDMEKDLRHRTVDTGQAELYLIESIIMCLTRLLPLLPANSATHLPLFWVALGVLQLDEVSLYAAGLALLEQNLLTLDEHGTFEQDSLQTVMMRCREQFILQYKQMDHAVGLSFRDSFHFALVGHLLKGFRHPIPQTVARTIRVLNTLLSIVAKPLNRDKYQVTKDSVAYLAALLPVSDEVRKRCRLKFRVPGTLAGPGEHQSPGLHAHGQPNSPFGSTAVGGPPPKGCTAAASNLGDWCGSTESLHELTNSGRHCAQRTPSAVGLLRSLLPNPVTNTVLSSRFTRLRQDNLSNLTLSTNLGADRFSSHAVDHHGQTYRSFHGRHMEGLVCFNLSQPRHALQRQLGFQGMPEGLRSRSIDSCPSTTSTTSGMSITDQFSPSSGPFISPPLPTGTLEPEHSASSQQPGPGHSTQLEKKTGDSVLLDPEILTEEATQALTIAVLTTLVRYTTDENESRVLYEFLADASMVFPRVFPVIHSLLDSKINYVLTHCHDQKILSAVQSIIQNVISSGETSVQQLHYLQSIGFGGLWRFSGHFSKANQNSEAAQLFVNFLEVLIDSHLPGEDLRTSYTPVLGLGSTSRAGNLSSSSSLSLSSLHGPLGADPVLNSADAEISVPLSPTLVAVPCAVPTDRDDTISPETVPVAQVEHVGDARKEVCDTPAGTGTVHQPPEDYLCDPDFDWKVRTEDYGEIWVDRSLNNTFPRTTFLAYDFLRDFGVFATVDVSRQRWIHLTPIHATFEELVGQPSEKV